MHRRILITLIASAALVGPQAAARAQDLLSMAEAVRQAVADACAEIGVSADGNTITDSGLATGDNVDALWDRMTRIRGEAADELAAAKKHVDSPLFAARVKDLASVRDTLVDVIEQQMELQVEARQFELTEAQDRQQELEEEVGDLRQSFDGAMELQLQTLRSHGQELEGAYGSMSAAMSELDQLLKERRQLEARQSSIFSRVLFGVRNTSGLEDINDRIAAVGNTVARAIEIVNVVHEEYGRESIPTMESDDPDAVRQASRNVRDALGELVENYEQLQQKETALEQKKTALVSARAEVENARKALENATRNAAPAQADLDSLREAQEQLEGMWDEYDEAREVHAAIAVACDAIRDCVEKARSSSGSPATPAPGSAGGTPDGPNLLCRGTWSWGCWKEDGEGGEDRLDRQGSFELLLEQPGNPDATTLGVVMRLREEGGPVRIASGSLTRSGGNAWSLDIAVIDDQGLYIDERPGHHVAVTGDLQGDPFGDQPLAGAGRMRRLESETGRTWIRCTGSWTAEP